MRNSLSMAPGKLRQIVCPLLVWESVCGEAEPEREGVPSWCSCMGESPGRAPDEGKCFLAAEPYSLYQVLVPALSQPLATGGGCVVGSLAVVTFEVFWALIIKWLLQWQR
ncbi:hypothetical protein E2C01_082001 [Portunus trituberculatus]|uniref:Uncharacterized protein n=1 Tax=Portunus trituberculatus TaxID=210409 RepID=A0A5B7J2M1_PORTR|nr:hypothetical protein [Portunus trituberculatus]